MGCTRLQSRHNLSIRHQQVRNALAGRLDHSETLERFRRLQYTLSCLVEAGNVCSSDAFCLLNVEYPWLIRRVVEVLEFAVVRRFLGFEAGRDACEAINRFLFSLHALKQSTRVSTATPTSGKMSGLPRIVESRLDG